MGHVGNSPGGYYYYGTVSSCAVPEMAGRKGSHDFCGKVEMARLRATCPRYMGNLYGTSDFGGPGVAWQRFEMTLPHTIVKVHDDSTLTQQEGGVSEGA